MVPSGLGHGRSVLQTGVTVCALLLLRGMVLLLTWLLCFNFFWQAKTLKEPKAISKKWCAKYGPKMGLKYTEPLCKVCVGRMVRKESDALYAKCFGSVKDEITSTFKEFKKLIADRTPTVPTSHPSPMGYGHMALGSQETGEV